MNPNQNPNDPQKQGDNKAKADKSGGSKHEQRRAGRSGERGAVGFEGMKEMGADEVERLREMGTDEVERLKQMGGEQLDNLREMGNDLERRIAEQVHERPLVALGVAFGAGVLVSTMLTSRLGRFALLAGGGYVVKQMLGERMMDYAGDAAEDADD